MHYHGFQPVIILLPTTFGGTCRLIVSSCVGVHSTKCAGCFSGSRIGSITARNTFCSVLTETGFTNCNIKTVLNLVGQRGYLFHYKKWQQNPTLSHLSSFLSSWKNHNNQNPFVYYEELEEKNLTFWEKQVFDPWSPIQFTNYLEFN